MRHLAPQSITLRLNSQTLKHNFSSQTLKCILRQARFIPLAPHDESGVASCLFGSQVSDSSVSWLKSTERLEMITLLLKVKALHHCLLKHVAMLSLLANLFSSIVGQQLDINWAHFRCWPYTRIALKQSLLAVANSSQPDGQTDRQTDR